MENKNILLLGTKLIMIYGLYDDIKFECQVKIWINTGSSENLIKKLEKKELLI